MKDKIIVENWKKTGLLVGIDDDFHQEQTAYLLENQRTFNEKYSKEGDLYSIFQRMSIPLVSRIYGRFLPFRWISMSTMGKPNEGVFIARTRRLETKFPISEEGDLDYPGTESLRITGDYGDLVDQYSGLDLEAHITARLAGKIESEITREIMWDLLNTANMLEVDWKSTEHLVDCVRMNSNHIWKNTGNNPNWLVTSKYLAEELSQTPDFDEADIQQTVDYEIYFRGRFFPRGPQTSGMSVYVDSILSDIVLMGFLGPISGPKFRSGYRYCPYIPLSLLSGSILSRYGKKLIDDGFYTRINVLNYNKEHDGI